MVTAVRAIDPISKVSTVLPVEETKLRPNQDFAARYTDTLQSLDGPDITTKPTLEPLTQNHSISPAVMFARMMDTIQKYVKSTASTAELKHASVGRKMTAAESKLRAEQHKAIEAQTALQTWNTRQTVANCLLHGVTTLTGVGLAAAGNPIAGASLIASGVGNTASEMMKYYEWNSTLTAALSIVSGLVGVVGGIGSGAMQAFRNPHQLLQQLTSGSLVTTLQSAGFATSLFATGLSGYSQIHKHKTGVMLAELQALHTHTEASLKVLQEKYQGAATGFQGTTKNFSNLLKTIAKTHNRYTRDCMRMLTAEFPA